MKTVTFFFDIGDVVQVQPCLSVGIVRGMACFAGNENRYLVRRVEAGKSAEEWEREIDLKAAECEIGFVRR